MKSGGTQMKLIPRSEFDADLFAEEMGNVHTPKDAESFRDWLLFEGYKSTDDMTNGECIKLPPSVSFVKRLS